MNAAVTSKEEILKTSRELIRQQGWSTVSIRAVAAACGVSVGSIYNYFDSKAALMSETIGSVWQEIFHRPDDADVFRDVQTCITWIYTRIAYGCEQYPGFFTLHSIGFLRDERPDGKQRMQQTWGHILAGLCAVLLAFLVGAGIMLLCGFDPIQCYGALFEGALGKPRAIGNTLAKATTLALCGLAMSVAAKAGIFNVGGEGQLFMGALAAAVVGAQSVAFALEGQSITAPVENGTAKAVFTLHDAHLWDGVEDPFLYTVSAKLDNGEETSARFGCRKFEFDPQKGFILNGRSYPLRGVSRHQDRKGAGIALTNEMMEEDMALILEMGANTIRLAHYQHAPYFYDLCDEKGLVIWAEIPYITMHMTNGRANTLTQMEELIVQNYNHPCIAVWGLSNEITAASAVNEELLENHRALNELAHRLDPTRPTTMANVFMLEITSPILEIPDVNSYNLYFGWYLGELDQNDDFFDTYHAKYPDRCIGFSEYGADANPAYQSAHPEKGDYTETYQCVYHEHMAKMIADRPWLWATHVWNMFDFAADGRDEGGKNGENQKGLVTFDRKIKKDAFYLYKAYWSKQPFVHTCGSRYVDRTEDVTEVRVYSNLPEVSLYKDGHLVETKKGDKVFVFNVPITGKHSIEARAGAYSSVILINKATEPNPAYAMSNRQVVNNWFDGELDETCWSVKDNMAAAMADAKVGPVLKAITDKAAAARGDVAAAVKDNPALVAMMERAMQRMTVEGMLKQAGADAESIKQLNRVLQGIKKDV